MSTPKFADTHNLVAFLEKPEESNGFEEIIDFLNASSVQYALTVNPTIYTSCIEQFWATTKVKTVNGERQLQALVDKKKVIITETSIRSDLNLEDAGGTDCLPTGDFLYPVIHHSPQETSEEVLQAREDLMKAIQTFLRKFSRISFGETPKVLLVAWERFSKIKHAFTDKQYQQEDIQELMSKLLEDVRNINEELSEFINSPSWNRPTFYNDDDEYTVIYRKPKAITSDLPTEEPDNSLSMGDEHLNTILETEKSSVENLVPIPSEFKGISEDICDVPSCDHFDAECGLINSLLSQDSSITSPKIDFLPEEFVGELDFIDPILPGIDEDDFDEEDFDDEEEGIDNDILQIEDEILREKLLNVNLLVDKIEALKLTPFIPFVLENPSSSPIPVVDSDFLVEEVDTFLVPEDSIPPGIESDLDSEGDIVFLDNLLNEDPIPEYERFTFDIEPDAPVINNFDELNEDECFDPGGGEIDVSQNIEDDDSFTFVIRTFLPFLTYPVDSPLLLSTGSEDTIFDPGIST
ncbi:hypothetical protein Tco_0079486 [Tanacetum coccineum]